jgi:hypothetical protein
LIRGNPCPSAGYLFLFEGVSPSQDTIERGRRSLLSIGKSRPLQDIREEDHADNVLRYPHRDVHSSDLFCDSRLRHDRNCTLLSERGVERYLYDSYKISRKNERRFSQKRGASTSNDMRAFVVIVLIGLRDAYYIKLVSGTTAAIGLLPLRDHTTSSGLTASNSAAYTHGSLSCWVS